MFKKSKNILDKTKLFFKMYGELIKYLYLSSRFTT